MIIEYDLNDPDYENIIQDATPEELQRFQDLFVQRFAPILAERLRSQRQKGAKA